MLSVNTQAPEFVAVDSYGTEVSIGGECDRTTLLYFYPKDDTSSCTIQANDFTALREAFEQAGAEVYGISMDSSASHIDFINKHNLRLGLLTDADGAICRRYGAWGEKEKNGVKKEGIIRSTFVIDRSGMLRYVEYGVSAPGHADQVLDFIRKMDN